MGKSTRPNSESDIEFREAMPATADYFSTREAVDPAEVAPEDESRFIAIVTLALVVLVIAALALLFMRGIDTIKSTVPQQQPAGAQPQSDSSGSLEL